MPGKRYVMKRNRPLPPAAVAAHLAALAPDREAAAVALDRLHPLPLAQPGRRCIACRGPLPAGRLITCGDRCAKASVRDLGSGDQPSPGLGLSENE